jgi:putative toxin-antitoxin system antitoxin component (TIGR02293 family)
MAAGAAIVSVLGGARVLGMDSGSTAQWERMVLEGMPVRSADALQETMALPEGVLAQLLGVSEGTLSLARAGTGRLGSLASHRLFCVARIVALAILVLESEQAATRWLMQPHYRLGLQPPVALLATQAGRDSVEKLLLRIGRDARTGTLTARDPASPPHAHGPHSTFG